MKREFRITRTTENGRVPVTIFAVQGDIDASTYTQLEEAARQEHAQGMRDLLIDLSEVGFVSSAGLRALHQIYTLLRRGPEESDAAVSQGLRDGSYKSRHLKLLCPNPNVQTAMKTAGFDMYIELFDARAAALAAFES